MIIMILVFFYLQYCTYPMIDLGLKLNFPELGDQM